MHAQCLCGRAIIMKYVCTRRYWIIKDLLRIIILAIEPLLSSFIRRHVRQLGVWVQDEVKLRPELSVTRIITNIRFKSINAYKVIPTVDLDICRFSLTYSTVIWK